MGMGAGPSVLAVVLVSILLCVPRRSGAIWLPLPAHGPKCVFEEIHNSVVVLADYIVIVDDQVHDDPSPTVTAKVTSPSGNIIHYRENATHGQFAFTSSETGTYVACFSVDGHNAAGHREININLIWKMGIAAKDWDSVARKHKLEGMELELTKLEEAVEAIHENLLYLKSREAEMRTRSETTNSRISSFSIISMGTCILVSTAQIFYLKKYFQKKKLI